MKILITGAAGRIGRAAHQALAADHLVTGLDRLPSATTDLQADLADPAAAPTLRRALQGVDAVIHSAALHAPHVGVWPDREFERIKVAATARLALLARQAGVRRFVFASTTALYGHAATPEGRAGWVDEALAPQPRTV
jgi:nucleoside-diphosphate-sugar epimerase